MQSSSHSSVIQASGIAELLWRVPGSHPRAIGVVPLVHADRPLVALPWAFVDDARSAAAAPGAALVLSDRRLTGSAWRPTSLTGRLQLVEDGDGTFFAEHLLAQEVRKHPRSRALVDSPMLRRENWWYLPRLVLAMDVDVAEPIRAREGADDAVLGVDDDGLVVRTVHVEDWAVDPLQVSGGPVTASGPAVLVGQEISVPDTERWTVHVTTGRYVAGRLTDVVPAATRDLEPVPGLVARVRRHRALEKACVSALRAAGHG